MSRRNRSRMSKTPTIQVTRATHAAVRPLKLSLYRPKLKPKTKSEHLRRLAKSLRPRGHDLQPQFGTRVRLLCQPRLSSYSIIAAFAPMIALSASIHSAPSHACLYLHHLRHPVCAERQAAAGLPDL